MSSDVVLTSALRSNLLSLQNTQSLIDKTQLRGLPQHGIGRSCKVGKEQVVGLLAALEAFDEAAVHTRHERAAAILGDIERSLPSSLPAQVCAYEHAASGEPRLSIELTAHSPLSARQLVRALQDGTPCIHVDPGEVDANRIVIVPTALTPAHAPIIAARLDAVLSA